MENNIQEKNLNFFTRIINSVEGIKHYKYILKETVGKAIIYLLLLSLILGVVASIRTSIIANTEISKLIHVYTNDLPNFELKNGELNVEGNMPMVLSEDRDYYVVIDTTNNTNPKVLDSYDKGLLILKDRMIEKRNTAQFQTIDFKALQGVTINKSVINNYLPITKLIIPFIYIVNILGYFLGGLLSALFLALVALIINAIFRTDLKYGEIYIIAIYALTTPMIIDVFFKIFNIQYFSYYSWLYHIIAFAYICFSLNKLKISKNNNEIIY